MWWQLTLCDAGQVGGGGVKDAGRGGGCYGGCGAWLLGVAARRVGWRWFEESKKSSGFDSLLNVLRSSRL